MNARRLTAFTSTLLGTLFVALFAPLAIAEPADMRVAGNFSANGKHVGEVERPFFGALAKNTGLKTAINYNTMDAVGVQAADALRLLRSGAFDVMSVQIGMASRDDPFFEGIDLIGVAPDMNELKKVVAAYRESFDRRLQTRFNAKAMTLWPFGPQVVYCNAAINSIDDLKGQKVRVFTQSMAALMQHFGATPVTLPFSEVYPALQRGVATCAVTSPTSGNTGKWPEVTTHFLPLSLSGSVQGHFMNLDHWKKYSSEQQAKLVTEFGKMEETMWGIAFGGNDDAVNCNVGKDSCKDHQKFKMTLVNVSAADVGKVKAAVTAAVLPIWKKTCNNVDPKCTDNWNQTVGKVTGFTIQ